MACHLSSCQPLSSPLRAGGPTALTALLFGSRQPPQKVAHTTQTCGGTWSSAPATWAVWIQYCILVLRLQY